MSGRTEAGVADAMLPGHLAGENTALEQFLAAVIRCMRLPTTVTVAKSGTPMHGSAVDDHALGSALAGREKTLLILYHCHTQFPIFPVLTSNSPHLVQAIVFCVLATFAFADVHMEAVLPPPTPAPVPPPPKKSRLEHQTRHIRTHTGENRSNALSRAARNVSRARRADEAFSHTQQPSPRRLPPPHECGVSSAQPKVKAVKAKSEHAAEDAMEISAGRISVGGMPRVEAEPGIARGASMRVKKKARSRANSDDEGESYARPTALFPSDPSLLDYPAPGIRPVHPSEQVFPLTSNPNAFSALSSVAMEELYVLERTEAMRRAEYEVRHLEALRRAEYEARHADIMSYHGRLSKSATTTPVMTPFYPAQPVGHEEGGYFGVSRERDRVVADDEHVGDARASSRYSRPRSVSSKYDLMAHTSGHVVDGPHAHARTYAHAHTPPHAVWGHPYHHAYTAPHRQHLQAGPEDSPSPISSDSDSMQPAQSPMQVSPVQVPLGHAYDQRRSPILAASLPGAVSSPSRPRRARFWGPTLESPIDDYGRAYDAHSRKSSVAGSPPTGSIISGRMAKRGSSGDLVSYASFNTQPYAHEQPMYAAGLQMPYTSERTATTLQTPQLSSGPSSRGSSPRNHPHPLHPGSSSSSRAPSPPLSAQTVRGGARDHPHHHHLAHSPLPYPDGCTPAHFGADHSYPSSTPASRSSSPPIKLPPLNLPSSPESPSKTPFAVGATDLRRRSHDGSMENYEREKVELPGFSEFAAASGLGAHLGGADPGSS
ncbi:hypothetical protein A0H81_11159 [Grifola frondosa]|uniref:Uncharacterized protein n=1 Tax=Grifola frondosa TaxID=5627 RepID=A0A1C7M1M4_GRIFR|nr:hypothetical protein A0H81_11159 [Grifola frondosa]